MQPIQFGGMTIGGAAPLVLIAGPCMAESLDLCREGRELVVPYLDHLGVPYRLHDLFQAPLLIRLRYSSRRDMCTGVVQAHVEPRRVEVTTTG